MLDKLLQIVGVDLQAQLAQVIARANAFKETTKREIRAEIAHASVTAGLALAAMLALVATCVIALIAFYIWMKPQYGELMALAAVGAVTASIAVIMGLIAASRTQTSVTVPEPVVAPPQPKPQAAMPPPLNLAAMVAPPPPKASLVDVLAHRVSTRAAGAADEAIDVAEDTIAHGSRTALVGTIAATVLIGWMVGRRSGI